MSQLKINSDVFLGSQELNRFKKFLDDDGFRKIFLQDAISFGIFNNSKSGNYNNYLVQQGTNVGTIKHSDGIAANKFGNLIVKLATDNIVLPNDNTWYWLKIKHQLSPLELGTVAIDINGNLTGTSTEFLSILRGLPNNPVLIRLNGSVSNTGEYAVVEVINDTSAILSGDFIAESNLKLVVVGAFTPDTVTPFGSKDIFQYDSCLMTLVAETVLNTAPSLLSDEEFVLARVRRNGSVVSIEDKRNAIYKSKSDHSLSRLISANNPLIGIEAIKFDNNLKPRDVNLVYMAWSFRSTNWTIDTSANRLTLIAGNGGKFKDTTYFTDGDFNGWRAYAKNSVSGDSHYAIIKSSSKSGTQINLILDKLDPDLFIDTAQEIIITPDADSIEIFFAPHPADATELTTLSFLSKINQGLVRFPVTVYKNASCLYNVKYRLNTFGDYRKPIAIPADTASGYFIESDFDVNGVQIASVKQTYTSHDTNGFVTLNLASNAYTNRIAGIETGDLFGTEHLILNNTTPIVDYVVGQKKQYQIVETKTALDGGQGDPFILTVDHYINLHKTGVTNLKGGNSFVFQFKGNFTLGAFNLKFTQDYVNSGSPGTILYTFTAYDLQQSTADNLLFRCIYDSVDAKWVVYRMIHNQSVIDLSGKADKTITISAGSGMTGGGDLSANRSFAVDATVVRTTRNLVAGSGLGGGGDLTADRTFQVNVDSATIEISADTLRLPNGYKAVQSPDGNQVYTKTIDIGNWNIPAGFRQFAHSLDWTKILSVNCFIRDDANSTKFCLLGCDPSTGTNYGSIEYDSTNIMLKYVLGGPLDTTNFDGTGFSRGYVIIHYLI